MARSCASFWVRRPISEPNTMVRRGPAEIPARHHTMCRRCRQMRGCDPTTVTGSLSLLAGVPARSWPSASPRCLGSQYPPCQMLTACRRADAAADTASGRQHPVCAKLRLHERWEFLLEQVRRAQLSILSSRCDTHLMNLRSFCSSSSRKTHLFFSKSLICMALGKIHLY